MRHAQVFRWHKEFKKNEQIKRQNDDDLFIWQQMSDT